MKILIIEDDDYKYKNIVRDLNVVVEDLNIFRLNNCMDALMYFRSLKNNCNNDYDLLITDNYMPLRKDSFDLVQSAIYIINGFKNDVSENVPICVCSADKFNVKCDYDYSVLYEPTKSLQEDFSKIIDDINRKENDLKDKKILKISNK